MNSPLLKLGCYLLALVLFQFLDLASNITAEQVAQWAPWDWLKFIAKLLVPAALIVRTYTDSSLPRAQGKMNERDTL